MSTTRKYKLTAKFERLSQEPETPNVVLNQYMRLCTNILEDILNNKDLDTKLKTFTNKQFGALYRDLWTEEPSDIHLEIKTMLDNLQYEGLIEEV